MIEQETIVDKILKLKALSEGTSNQHEAELAAEKMSELMRKHCIEAHQLTDKPDHEHSTSKIKYMNPWRRDLITACGEACFCHVVFGRGEDINIVGRPLNVRACYEMFYMIEKQIVRIARELYPRSRFHDPKDARKAQVRAEGGLGQGVAVKIKESNQKNSDHLLPVVQENKAAESAAHNFMPNIRSVPAKGHRKSREHLTGEMNADRVQLRDEVNG